MRNFGQSSLFELDGERILWVASSGGHIREAIRWSKILGHGRSGTWVTSDSEHARSMLNNHRSFFLSAVGPRDLLAPFRFFLDMLKCVPRSGIHTVISTGASPAIPVLAYFSLMSKKRIIFIELLTRIRKPSLSGKLVALLPRIELFSPHPNIGRRWDYLDPQMKFEVETRSLQPKPQPGLKVLVMGGTTGISMERFSRLLSRVLDNKDQVVVQGNFLSGAENVIRRQNVFTINEILELILWSDVVVTHAGVGSVLDCLEAGRKPVVIPRLRKYGEHVDDHQSEFVHWLLGAGLAFDGASDRFDRSTLVEAARVRVLWRGQ